MNDQDLKDYFRSSRPEVGDGDAFMEALSSRMEAAERIRSAREEIMRTSSRIMRWTLLICCTTAAAVIAFLLMNASSVPDMGAVIQASVSSFPAEWRQVFCAAVAVVAMASGMIPLRKHLSRY